MYRLFSFSKNIKHKYVLMHLIALRFVKIHYATIVFKW